MEDEKIIRIEAEEFVEFYLQLDAYEQSTHQLARLKQRLGDFYSDESKAIFLDQIKIEIETQLKEHRDERHGGEASETCEYEKRAEKLLFYLRQELQILPLVAHQKESINKDVDRKRVFVSYSHADKEYLKGIQKHFKPFLDQIDFWDDTKIEPGQKWKEEIRKAIAETKVAILLVSADFLASDFIATDELPPLLQSAEDSGAVILIVIIRPCLFEEFDDLNQFQAMNAPSNPVVKMNEIEREELLVNLVRQTKRILES